MSDVSHIGRADIEQLAQKWLAFEAKDCAERDTCLRAIRHFGSFNQMEMAQEECAELIVKVFHAKRERIALDGLAEEIADVEIMCRQLRLLVGDELVDTQKAAKLARLEERIASHGGAE